VRDRTDRAGILAGVAADADLWVDQVLPDDSGVGQIQGASPVVQYDANETVS
jgi:hypothetical protein